MSDRYFDIHVVDKCSLRTLFNNPNPNHNPIRFDAITCGPINSTLGRYRLGLVKTYADYSRPTLQTIFVLNNMSYLKT